MSKLTQEVQQITTLVKSKDLELQMMPGLVDEASPLWKNHFDFRRMKIVQSSRRTPRRVESDEDISTG